VDQDVRGEGSALSTGAESDARDTGVAGFVRGFLYQKTDHFQSVKIVLTR
jgi:hypothetical protein